MTMDVMLCTASILNLCAISVDRYIAVVVPLKYNRNQFSVRQLTLIAATWLLSVGVASPVIFGLNQVPGRDPSVCRLENDQFVVYSSVCSFFVPCPVMLFLYYWMFRGLRRWSGRSRSHVGLAYRPALALNLSSAPQRANTSTSESQEKVTYAAPDCLSPASLSTVSTVAPSVTPVTEEQQDGGTVDSDPITTQVDSTSERALTEQRESSLMKRSAARRRRRGSKSSRVSGRERKAMKECFWSVGRRSSSSTSPRSCVSHVTSAPPSSLW
ncbi:dopamine receptor D4 related sequence isoform X2 [Cheilinus undulatus]|uniref:dopamine receptor D4 related sequence isoform X2 n=1 Tax=Cheilinus undulatus TaxID=241271 RepID=UPI001BD55E28|nr:dopamine receptor D4 related sequence isoform X2 [Cheilinus undulatus]